MPSPFLQPEPPPLGDFRTVYRAELKFVWSFLRRLGIEGKNLEDRVQDVFLTAFRRLSTYDPSRPIRPWLLGIAYRVAAEDRRHARRTVESFQEDLTDIPDDQPGLDARLESEQVRTLLYRSLDTLDFDRRSIVVLHDLEGMTVPVIAEALDVPLSTAYSRLRLARKALAAAVHRELASRGEA